MVRTLRKAAGRVGEAAETSHDLAERRGSLLRQALEIHQAHGDAPRPVCGVGAVDAAWRTRGEAELAAEDERLREHRERSQWLSVTRSAAEELAHRVPTPSYQEPFTLAHPAGSAGCRGVVVAARAGRHGAGRPPGDDL